MQEMLQKDNKERQIMFKRVDFSEEKAQLALDTEKTRSGIDPLARSPEGTRFKEIEKEIEESLNSIIEGMGPFRIPYRPQKNTLTCLVTLSQLKEKKTPSASEVNVFLNIIRQELGQITFDYIHKMLFGEKNG